MLPFKPSTQGSLARRFGRRNEILWRETYAYSDLQNLFVVKPAKGKGNGLFATKTFKEGDYMLTYWGKRIDNKTYQILEKAEYGLGYVFNYESKVFINAENPDESGIARFANDEVEAPNMRSFSYIFQSKSHIGFKAIRDIEVGEELTYNYGQDVIAPWRNTQQSQSDDETNTRQMTELEKRKTPIYTDKRR